MTTYAVSRTSCACGNRKPCDGAVEFSGNIRYTDADMTLEEAKQPPASYWFLGKGTYNHHQLKDGGVECWVKRTFWIIEVESILAFFQEHGRIVIHNSDYVEYPIELEIYDEYRE